MNTTLLFLLACCCVVQDAMGTSKTKMSNSPGFKSLLVDTDCRANTAPAPSNANEYGNSVENEITENANSRACSTSKNQCKGSAAKTGGFVVETETDPNDLSYVNHSFYKSALIWNKDYFAKHWINITNGTDRVVVHPTLKNSAFRHSYRDFSLQMRLPFEFPFYGHYLENITICTGGYVYTGPPNSHHWFAQEQSIAPLMVNFDVSLDDSSAVALYEEATRITIVWENMKVRERHEMFTFAVTLCKNGDIHFAYKDIPVKIQALNKNYSVFIGLADSYFLNKLSSYVRRRTIHNYSRIPFNAYHIKSGSVLQLIALPSCPIYNTCKACTGHGAKYGSFKCMWCDALGKCTSGADYFRPYMADCTFEKICNDSSDDNDTMPRLSFFHRVFNFVM